MKANKFLTIIFAVFMTITQTVAQSPREWKQGVKRAKRAFINGVDIKIGQNISHAGLIKALKEDDRTKLRISADSLLDEIDSLLVYYNETCKDWGFDFPSDQDSARALALAILEDADTMVASWDTLYDNVWMSFLDPDDKIDFYRRQPRHIMNPRLIGKEIVLVWGGKVLTSLFCVNPIWDMGPRVTRQDLLVVNEDALKPEETKVDDSRTKKVIHTAGYGRKNDYVQYKTNPDVSNKRQYEQKQEQYVSTYVQPTPQNVEVAQPYVPIYVIPVEVEYYYTENQHDRRYDDRYSYGCGGNYSSTISVSLFRARYGYSGGYYYNSYPYYNSYRYGYNSYPYYNSYRYGYNSYPYYNSYGYGYNNCR